MFVTRSLFRIFCFAQLVCVLSLSTACSDDGPGGRPPTSGSFDPDVEDIARTPDTPEETQEDTGPTGPPGFMHGEWEVRKADGDQDHLYTLQLEHIEGETTVTGTYTWMENGSSGLVSPGSLRNDIFEISWTRLIHGGERTFGIVGAEKQSDDLLIGDHNDYTCLCDYRIHLIRKP